MADVAEDTGGSSGLACRGQTVLLIDDDPDHRSDVAAALRGSEFTLTGQADSLASAMQLLAMPAPALALVDMSLPDGMGCTFLAAARARWGMATSLLVLSSFGDKAMVGRAIAHGAQGYMSKGARPEALLARMRRQLRDGYCFGPDIARMIYRDAAAAAAPRRGARYQDTLTAAEHRVLALLCEGMTNPEMARALGLGTSTIKSHVDAILAKTSASNRLMAANRARELGWI